MRDEWNEELRRAYDRGYWDARREFEHHLKQSHSGEFRDSRQNPGFMGESGGERGEYRGGGHREQRGWQQGRSGGESYRQNDRGGEYSSDQGRYGDYGSARGSQERRHDDDRYRGSSDRGRYDARHSGGGGRPEHHERGFFERIGDEVSSWFDDDDRNRDRSGLSRDFNRDVTGYRNR